MFLLDWRLAVVLARRCCRSSSAHAPRRRASASASRPSARSRWPTCSRSSRSRCRSRASCSARRWAAPTSSPTASTRESERLADLEVRQRMAGPLADGLGPDDASRSCPRSSTGSPGSASRTAARDHDRHASSPSRRCRRGCSSRSVAAVGRIDVQTSLALFDRIFEYLDLPVDIAERADAVALDRGDVRGEVALRGRLRSATRPTATRTLDGVDLASRPGTHDRDRRRDGLGQDDARLPRRAPLRRRRGRRDDRRRRRARPDVRLARRHRRRRLPGDLPLPRLRAREPALRAARRDRRGARGRRRARRASTTSSPRCPTATTPSSASAATASPAARSSASRSPARSCATRRCSCSTRRRARSTPRPSAPCRRRSTARRGPHDDRDRPPPLDRPRRRPDRRARPTAAIAERGTHDELAGRRPLRRDAHRHGGARAGLSATPRRLQPPLRDGTGRPVRRRWCGLRPTTEAPAPPSPGARGAERGGGRRPAGGTGARGRRGGVPAAGGAALAGGLAGGACDHRARGALAADVAQDAVERAFGASLV